MNRRDFVRRGAAGVVGGSMLGVAPPLEAGVQQPGAAVPLAPQSASGRGADLALLNAKIITLEPRQPEAQAVLVRNGRIVLVGSNAEVKAQAGRATVFDGGGRTVTPGIVDAHCHFEMACNAASYQVPCHAPPHKSLKEIQATLKAKAAQTPPGTWVIGRAGFGLQNSVEERRLATREDLDAVSTAHPIVLFSGFHVAMFNTRGFQETGLWEGKPPRGAFVHRDSGGVPTGVATEVWTELPPYSIEEVRASVKAHAARLFLAKGITSISTLPYWSGDLRADQDLQAAGDLAIRLRAYYHVPKVISLDALIDTGWRIGAGDDMFRFGGIKIFIDGTANDGAGHPLEDYKWSQPELDEFVARAHGAGIQLAMHCLTNGGHGMGMNAVEAALKKDPRPLRHRLEHASRLQSVEEIRRLKSLGMMATLLPPTSRIPPGGSPRRGFPYRSYVSEGAEPICVTDATGTTPVFSPWVSMAGIVASPQDGGGAAADQTVPFADALKMWTLWAAKGGFEEQHKGLDRGRQARRLRRVVERSTHAPAGGAVRPRGRRDDRWRRGRLRAEARRLGGAPRPRRLGRFTQLFTIEEFRVVANSRLPVLRIGRGHIRRLHS